ncbi:MAG: RNA-binding protein [Bacteroidetes bacterium]|nr:MAG: RNA-binding protein [Bacteroidota bacterium]
MRIYHTTILLICISILSACHHKKTLFQSLSSSRSGVGFSNKVEENDKYNVLNYMNIYTGAGVAAGDINNDGLTDLFFSGNETSCRLYVNKGNIQFEDVTEKAGLITNRWCTGVSMVDINQDGYLDIYINVAGSAKFGNTANLLYINNKNGTFTEEAEKYGIADARLTMNASFFDYDRDGDLDLFLITNPADERVDDVTTVLSIQGRGESSGADILYRNNGNGSFTDVSKAAGIVKEGFSLGTAISDINNDGWPDIYVSNDFLHSDILYINNHDGTFTDKVHECLKHTSFSSMRNDVADFNNDGLTDIFTLDMLPEGNFRNKFQLLLQKGYEPQYTRNVLQLNNGNGSFSDISFLSGVSSTDWSWAALFADYDNDGDKDLAVTNGFYRDFGDQDFINYQKQLHSIGNPGIEKEKQLKAIGELAKVPLQSYLFENNGDLSFTNRSSDWGFTEPGFSNGACYADLDNDGDLELITNQFNGPARIFKNNTNELLHNNYLTIKLTGYAPNLQAIGSKVYVYAKGQMQMQELNPYRGYESTVELPLHFGLGKNTTADSLKIIWPDGSQQSKYNIATNTVVSEVYSAKAGPVDTPVPLSSGTGSRGIFENVSGSKGLDWTHKENYFVDFKVQPLVPHMLSRCGPGIAVGDINNDGREDFYIGGASGSDGSFFIQDKTGIFSEQKLKKDTSYEDMGVLLFDADNDGDLDLFVVSGSSEKEEGSVMQQDRLYVNDGKGNFSYRPDALPDTRASGSCVAGCDYDKDGDVDLFVGGRVIPGKYPLTPQSYLLKNTGGRFSNASFELPANGKMGMVTSALWTDFDNDGWIDLMITGEFMPILFIKNKNGKLLFNSPLVIANSAGWWNSITAGDFDEDGDIDYVVGNLGLNTRLKARQEEPLCIYAKDFDKNGAIDPVMCYYMQGHNYVYPSRDELIGQIPVMRKRFELYRKFASVTFEETFSKEELGDAFIVKAECFESSYLENKGNGKFERKALPIQCQFAPLFGMVTGDYNNDGRLDVLLAGNSYSTEVSTGNYDAMTGVLLLGDGKGNFKPLPSAMTGFMADGDAKGMARINLVDNSSLILVANNNGKLQSYETAKDQKFFPVTQNDEYAIIHKKDGSSFKQELYLGSTYLSSSPRMLAISEAVDTITIYNNKGVKWLIR